VSSDHMKWALNLLPCDVVIYWHVNKTKEWLDPRLFSPVIRHCFLEVCSFSFACYRCFATWSEQRPTVV
jgi:hypothetical protein